MKRLEIIVNSAVEEDVLEILEHLEGHNGYYTKINHAQGVGSSGPRMGDHIWPEENTIFIIYLKKSQLSLLETSLNGLKNRFPDVGIKYFVL